MKTNPKTVHSEIRVKPPGKKSLNAAKNVCVPKGEDGKAVLTEAVERTLTASQTLSDIRDLLKSLDNQIERGNIGLKNGQTSLKRAKDSKA